MVSAPRPQWRRHARRLLGEKGRWRVRFARWMVQCARVVDQPLRHFAAEFAGRPRLATYTVQGRPLQFRHYSHDLWIFHEVFVDRVYDLPTDHPRPRRIVDLGGNVGLFALYSAIHWPQAEITAFEPDPDNAGRYRWMIEHNRIPGECIQACAAAHPGTVSFELGEESLGRVVSEGSGSEVPAVDAFPYLATADLIKMDIEGGEWALLLDPRFADLPASTVVMEYHPHLCPGDDARAAATAALRDAGYVTHTIFHDPGNGVGMLRALRLGHGE